MGDEGYITDKTPEPEAFRFSEIVEDTRPYKMIGYVEGVCPDSSAPYGYIPPTGWVTTSCTWMPPGSHGVGAGRPTILVTCEPIKNDIPPIDVGELTSVLYPRPTDRVTITGQAYSIPGVDGFYIEQPNSIRYATYGISLANLGYVEGEQVVARVKLSPVYEDIIDIDQWGYIAELIDIKRAIETDKSLAQPTLTPVGVLALGGAGLALLGGFIWYNLRQKR